MVQFMCYLDWATVCPDVWSHVVLVALARVFLDEISILIDEQNGLPSLWWGEALSNQLKSQVEQKHWPTLPISENSADSLRSPSQHWLFLTNDLRARVPALPGSPTHWLILQTEFVSLLGACSLENPDEYRWQLTKPKSSSATLEITWLHVLQWSAAMNTMNSHMTLTMGRRSWSKQRWAQGLWLLLGSWTRTFWGSLT
jgi:hypothetical protein